MSLKAQIIFWLVALGVVVLAMWLLGEVMTPFVAGMVLAYFLDPLADRLEEWGLPRLAATSLIMAVAVSVFIVAFVLLAPLLAQQLTQFMERAPGYVEALVRLFNDNAPPWLKDAVERTTVGNGGEAAGMAARAAGWAASLLKSIWSGSMALFNMLSLLIITPIVLFYMLNDWDRMVAVVDGWLPRHHADTVRAIARDMDSAMAGFIRGQGTVCLILGLFYAVALVGAGLNFGLLIGLTAGFLSFIPYVGSIVGGVMAIGTALVQFWPDWVQVLIIAVIFGVGQFLEGNFLSPKLVGGRIGLHPVWLMFALMAFGYLFGFIGLLMAVPVAAAIRVVAQYALRQYMNSPLYLGEDGGDAADGEMAAGEGEHEPSS